LRKPTWVKVIGILGIVFGCTGILGSMHLFVMPQMYEFWGAAFDAIDEEARHDPDYPDQVMEHMRTMWEAPDWFTTWAILFGIAGVLVAAYYLISAIMLLQVKPNGDKMMISALAASMIVAVVQAATVAAAGGFIAIMMGMGAVFGFVIDLVLLVVILTSDRTIFRQAARTTGDAVS
jgi:hypothetical protein